jgi:hypothetical protein
VVELPEDLQRALGTNVAAREYFDGLACSNQRECLSWIAEARRGATRVARIEKALLMLEQKKKVRQATSPHYAVAFSGDRLPQARGARDAAFPLSPPLTVHQDHTDAEVTDGSSRRAASGGHGPGRRSDLQLQ